jgi:hypothetical protein
MGGQGKSTAKALASSKCKLKATLDHHEKEASRVAAMVKALEQDRVMSTCAQ